MRRGAPPVEIEVRPSGAWRAFVAGVAVLAMASVLAWIALDDDRRASLSWWGAGGALCLACVATAASLWPRGSARLGFDGDGWSWQAPMPHGVRPVAQPVQPRVAIDLGRVLLLQLTNLEPTDGRRRRWVALERHVDAPTWHAMRCALHDTRPAPPVPVATLGPGPGAAP